jgi:type VI secretion system protein
MTLTLKIINHDRFDHGVNPELVLNNRGANIGRSLTCKWVLPDEARVVSGKHCEIQFRDNCYFLIDFGSTNGTFLGQSEQRLEGAHQIAQGDRFRIGPYVVEAKLAGAALHQYQSEQDRAAAAARGPGFGDWNDVPGGRPPPPPPPPPAMDYPANGSWDISVPTPDRASIHSEAINRTPAPPSADDIFGKFTEQNEIDWNNIDWTVDDNFDPFKDLGGDDSGFAPLPGGVEPTPGGGGGGGFAPLPGGVEPAPIGGGGGGFAPLAGIDPEGLDHGFGPLPGNNVAPPPAPPTGGNFAPLDPVSPHFPPPAPPPSPEPVNPDATVGPWGPEGGVPDPGFPRADPAAVPAPVRVRPSPVPHDLPPAAPEAATPEAVPPPAAPPRPDAVFGALLGELGVSASQTKLSPEESAGKAGRMLRHLLAGLMILLEARARAKEEMGASGTALGFDGNNPLKFARNVDQALQMMLNPPLRGYMEAEDAIEEAYRDLQAHQIATLKAMQGALRETLNRFSPSAIKARTKDQGLLAKVLPGQREAAMWRAYEEQFSGVAEGSAEAFLEVFSREFRRAYEEANHRPRR